MTKKHVGMGALAFAVLGVMASGCTLDAAAPDGTEAVAEQSEADTGTNPCTNFCSPSSDMGWTLGAQNFTASNIGTGAVCRYTYNTVNGGNCSNMSGRTLKINGVTKTCNGSNWTSIPPASNAGWCIQVSAGGVSYASYTLWR